MVVMNAMGGAKREQREESRMSVSVRVMSVFCIFYAHKVMIYYMWWHCEALAQFALTVGDLEAADWLDEVKVAALAVPTLLL